MRRLPFRSQSPSLRCGGMARCRALRKISWRLHCELVYNLENPDDVRLSAYQTGKGATPCLCGVFEWGTACSRPCWDSGNFAALVVKRDRASSNRTVPRLATRHGETKLLLLACAAVGLPSVLLLDEPFSDVQPPYRHEVIRALQVLRSTRATSIIITSYRMSLCELVCDRVAVIKAAKVEALGDAEQMNQKYGRCYTVKVRLPPGRHYDYDLQSNVLLKVQEEFHEATLQQLYEDDVLPRLAKMGRRQSERAASREWMPGVLRTAFESKHHTQGRTSVAPVPVSSSTEATARGAAVQ
ncbi:uncharacterized protein LOC144154825 isoform X2 [Haemaphysalis longicornis]